MKYFYAVVHCNSKKTAQTIYDEYNHFEFEQSNIRLLLSFIADELVFPQEPKEVSTELPADYEFKYMHDLNASALAQTKVKMTWDLADPKRVQKFKEIMDKSDVDEDEYREFLASSEEDEDRDKVEEYRQKLLGALTETGDISQVFRTKDLVQD